VNETQAIAIACQLIQQRFGEVPVAGPTSSIGGGCINRAIHLPTSLGPFFVKYNDSMHGPSISNAEHKGLKLLRQGPLEVPRIVGAGEGGVLVLHWIESALPARNYSEQLGRGLATMHIRRRSRQFGLDHDNWIGASPQPNAPHDSWIEFWRDSRLGPQLRLARKLGTLDAQALKMGDSLCLKLDRILIEPTPDSGGAASLLHGDLWNGNVLVGADGQPVLIDPAAYYGHSEAEFGILALFGGFDPAFFAAYHEVAPKLDGFSDRLEIYKLYHLLNHLNLFGSGYRNSCLSILRRFC